MGYHVYNPRYSGDRAERSLGKKLDSHLNPQAIQGGTHVSSQLWGRLKGLLSQANSSTKEQEEFTSLITFM
jgi:hypothetical protein